MAPLPYCVSSSSEKACSCDLLLFSFKIWSMAGSKIQSLSSSSSSWTWSRERVQCGTLSLGVGTVESDRLRLGVCRHEDTQIEDTYNAFFNEVKHKCFLLAYNTSNHTSILLSSYTLSMA